MVKPFVEVPITETLKEKIKIGPFGSQLKKETLVPYGDYKVYGQENIYSHDFNIGDRFLKKEHYEKLSSCEIKSGDFLMSTMGTIGKCAIAPDGIQPGIMDSHLIRFRLDERVLLSEYLLHLFSSEHFYLSKQTSRLAVGGIMDGLSVGIANSLSVLMPEDVEEQRKIAKALSDVDTLITNLEKLIVKKTAIKQGAMQQFLSGHRRLTGYTKDWEEKTLESMCYLITKQTGFDYSAEIKPSLLSTNGVNMLPFIQNKDFEGFTINYDTDFYIPCQVAYKYPKILLSEKCLLVSISGRIGNVATFKGKREAFVGGAVGVAKFYDKSLVDWCMLYLQSEDGQRQIFESEKAGAQHNLTVGDVRKLIIPVPEEDERNEIVAIIKDFDNEIRQLQIKHLKLKNMKTGMMNELLTGRIRLV